MRLKRLELQGFKSFLNKTILNFDSSITGVVGPNGCGKSNIVDAIQWVMGEQSAKHLRGESMTDVIFNGSENHAATSMAEVTLVLDRSGVALSPQFSAFEKAEEISISRRVYRDGTGEYFINKTQCRLKDIHELFMDTGVGKRAYSIIEQGQIDRMVNVKPEDRRLLFEEVAGITKYKTKRKEAEKKLESTQQNLLRLQDIVLELEKQMRSLKVQSSRARKYRELKVEIEKLDLHRMGRSFYDLQKKQKENEEKKETLQNSRAELDAQVATLEAQVTSLDIQRIDQEKAYQGLGEKERALSLQFEQLEGEVKLIDERCRFLAQAIEQGQQNELATAENLSQLEHEVEALQDEFAQLESQWEANKAALAEMQKGVEAAHQERRQIEAKTESARSSLSRLNSQAVALEGQAQVAQSRVQEWQERETELNARLEDSIQLATQQSEHLKAAEEKIEQCNQRVKAAVDQVSSVNNECQALSDQLQELEEGLFATRQDFYSKRSRLESLQALDKNFEGYAPTARELLIQLQATGIQGVPLADLFQPQPHLESLLEIVLGDLMNTVVVPTTADLQNVTSLIETQNLERVRVVALSEMGESAGMPIENVETFLAGITVRPGYEKAAEWCLGQVALCGELSDLLAKREAHPDWTWVSGNGNAVAYPDHSVLTGKPPSQVGLFARRREIEQLAQETSALEAEVRRLTSEREEALKRLEAQEQLHSECKEKVSQLHMEAVEVRGEKERVAREITRIERDRGLVDGEVKRAVSQIEENQRRLVEAQASLSELEQQRAERQAELEETEKEVGRVQELIAKVTEDFNQARSESSRLAERKNSFEFKKNRLEDELEEVTERLESLRDRLQKDRAESESQTQRRDQVLVQKEEVSTKKLAVLAELSDVKVAFDTTCVQLQDARAGQSENQKKREEVLTLLQEAELALVGLNGELQQLRGVSLERYGKEPEPMAPSVVVQLEELPLLQADVADTWETLSEADRDRLQEEHLQNLKEKVSRYGEVNLTAITEYEEVQKRFEFLMEQKTDLEKSIGILEQAIRKIDESTLQRFGETFHAVNDKFKEIFPILFSGGKAELSLTQPDQLLESGIDILVHPPGKRPASISLLSGGEKALTAVSLVLAIFARKPSPFCLLDEVDAPLDDANVSRFNTVVRKMAEKTQFIVITHNKKTMEMSDALYGVTMERSGVSKMTSVRLS